MYVYVQFDDGRFEIVKRDRIPHLTACVDKNKKYKLLLDDKTEADVVVVLVGGKLFYITFYFCIYSIIIYRFFYLF